MSSMRIVECEHGVVMSCPGGGRIPAGVESAREFGMRYQHYGWPGITRTLDGDILVSASERVRHVDPFGREVISRSSDGGRTWTDPEVIFDSISDDRDHAVNTLPDGTVVSTWFGSMAWTTTGYKLPEWDEIEKRIKPDTLRALSRGWLRRSHDGGRTWEAAVYPTIVGQHAGPSVLANGDMIYCGPAPADDGNRLVATRSSDRGRSWSIVGEIPGPRVKNEEAGLFQTVLNESHALELGPDNILCVFRGSGGQHNIHMTRTSDGGRTWTEPQDIGVYGFPSYLIRLQAGPILCVFGDRRQPQAIRVVLSYDDGATWDTDNVLAVREFAYRADMGYPVSLEITPGEVLCVYYSMPDPGNEGYEDLGPVDAGILSTRIRLRS